MQVDKNIFHKFVSNNTITGFAKHDKSGIMLKGLEKIADLLRKEHYTEKSMPFTDQQCINLDTVEKELAKLEHRNRRNTVDFIIGTGSNWILPVEAKIAVEKPRNMDVGDLRKKIEYSKSIVNSTNADVHTETKTIVLLNTKNYQQLYRELRKKVGDALNIVPMSVSILYNEIFE